MGGRRPYKLIVSLSSLQSLHYNDTQVTGGRWPLQRFSVSGNIWQRFHCKDTQIMVGRWRCNIIVSLQYAKFTL